MNTILHWSFLIAILKSGQWHVWPPTSWYTSKQIAQKMISSTCMHWMRTHTWTVEAYLMNNNIYLMGGQPRWCPAPNWNTPTMDKITIDWTKSMYCSLTLSWHYGTTKTTCYVDISMPGCVEKCLHKFNHPTPKWPQNLPHPAPPPMFGLKVQDLLPDDISDPLDEAGKNAPSKFWDLSYSMLGPLTTLPSKQSTQLHDTLQLQQNT